MARSKCVRWCFTANNPDAGIRERLLILDCLYIVYGEEVAPSTGTPHLQGFFILHNARTLSSLSTELPGVHLERARGTSKQAADYCKKGGVFVERGVLPDSRGKRSDLERILEWLDEFIAANDRAPRAREVALEQPTALLRYRNFLELARLRAPPVPLRQGEPRPWQLHLEAELLGDADDRSVVFYVDSEGGKGKTWFQQYFVTKHPSMCQVLGDGKIADMAYAIDTSFCVYLINVTRDRMQFFQYGIVEQLKDRMVFSTKYETVMKTWVRNNHVVVFCNEPIDYTKLSEDRIIVRDL